jgi:hypothetical protein
MFGSAAKQALNMAGIGLLGVDFEGQKRRRAQLEALEVAKQRAAGLFQPVPGAVRQAAIPNDNGEDISAAFAPVMEQGPGRRRSPQEIAEALAQLSNTKGFDISPYAKLAEMAAPKAMNVNGRVIDERDPSNIGQFFGEAPAKGAEPVYDRQGREVGWRMAEGALAAIGQSTEAQELGKLRGSSMPVPTGDGGSQLMLGADWLARQGGGQGGQGGRLGYTPPAAQLSAAKIEADAGAQARVELPNNLATAQSMLETIGQLREHPGRKLGTGGTGVLPPIPGTPQKDFITLLEQAKGKTFLEAFGSLKGGGAISEREGQAAQAAIARLDRTQSEEGFLQALAELEQIVQRGAERAQAKAGARPAGPRPDRSAVEAELRRRGLLR